MLSVQLSTQSIKYIFIHYPFLFIKVLLSSLCSNIINSKIQPYLTTNVPVSSGDAGFYHVSDPFNLGGKTDVYGLLSFERWSVLTRETAWVHKTAEQAYDIELWLITNGIFSQLKLSRPFQSSR